jgi:hypothetical protein
MASDAVRMLRHLEAGVVAELRRRCRRGKIVIDLNPSEDSSRGAQQGSLFNGYYDSWCENPAAPRGTLRITHRPAPSPGMQSVTRATT